MVDGAVKPGSRVLVTGPTGFVGQAVWHALDMAGYTVQPGGRHAVGEIHRGTDWSDVLRGCDAVVHLAARVHAVSRGPQKGGDPFREVNVHGTASLAQQAVEARIRRFVLMSSVKVLGEAGENLSPDALPAPYGAYAVSKAEAEAAVRDIAGNRMAAVILRPPLIYGPGARANFERLMRLVAKGWPLPLGAVENRRSLIAVANLADAVRYSLTCRPGTYHPRDARNLSTPDLIRLIAAGMNRTARLLPVPPTLLRGLGRITGAYPAVNRLTNSFTTDGTMDGWTPPVAAEKAIAEAAEAFLKQSRL